MKNTDQSIAIVGMSCRFPGKADTPQQYWELLEKGVDAIADIPSERWDVDAYYDPDKEATGKMYTRQGGFLRHIDLFDNSFFRISPIEAESLDPQARLLLELSYEAIEGAGYKLGNLKGSSTGVFVGLSIVDYIEKDVRSANPHAINAYSCTGTQMSSASGRISFAFGLTGPSISLDTACSSSLVSVHMACKSLLNEECHMAIAGGVNLISSPKYHISFCRLNALSPDCRCKAFDASANGFVRSEGAGTVLLKRYADALRDGDHILAVIKGSAVTNDGTSKGYTVPNAAAQQKAITMALQNAGVSPNDISYFEAHGTGTPVGDPLEMEGISNAFAQRDPDNKLWVGSSKTNIGHCESAAGIAGLIKLVLCMQHETIPGNLHFQTPNPAIDWEHAPVKIPTGNQEWRRNGKPRYAAVNSLGLSGTNANIILSDAPLTTDAIAPAIGAAENGAIETGALEPAGSVKRPVFLLPLSAASPAALTELGNLYIDLLQQGTFTAEEICASAAARRSDMACRLAVTGADSEELVKMLREVIGLRLFGINNGEDKKVVFAFPGQGSQWIGMGLELMQTEPVFRDMMEACDRAIRLYADWSLLEEIKKEETGSRFGEVDVIQPVLFSMEVALAKLWMSWGLVPDAVIGHSMGEVAAAYIAGALTLEDAAAVICRRSLLAKTLSGKGAMVLTELGMQEAAALIGGKEDKVAIAASNSPKSTVLSGDTAVMHQLMEILGERQVFHRAIKVDFASHSPYMDLIKDQLLEQLGHIRPIKGKTPIYSTVKDLFTDGSGYDALYWSDNLRNPVLFSQGIQRLLEEDNCLVVEISPHPILVQLVQQNIEHLHRSSSAAMHTLRREQPQLQEMLNGLASLYVNGANIGWQQFSGIGRRDVTLPSYPWQREKCWLEDGAGKKSGLMKSSRHPFLGNTTRLASDKKTLCWQSELDLADLPYLKDHRVHHTILFPAAGYVEFVYAAAKESYGEGMHTIRRMEFKQPMPLGETARPVQLIFTKDRENVFSFQLFSSNAVHPKTEGEEWELHCTGELLLSQSPQTAGTIRQLLADYLTSPFPTQISRESHYAKMENTGIHYGPKFQGVDHIASRGKQTIGRIRPDASVEAGAAAYTIHPALLDACFQVLLGSLDEREKKGTYLPALIGEIHLFPGAALNETRWVVAETPETLLPRGDMHIRDLTLYNEEGEALARISGFGFKKLDGAARKTAAECLYHLTWQQEKEADRNAKIQPQENTGWLLFGDQHHLETALAQQVRGHKGRCMLVRKGTAFDIAEDNQGGHIYTIDPANSQHYRMLFMDAQIKGGLEQIVYLCGMAPANPLSGTFLSREDDFNCLGLTYIFQGLQNIPFSKPPRISVVTTALHVMPGETSDDQPLNIFQAPLWGLGRVGFHEHQEFDCTRIDVGGRAVEEEALTLFLELASGQSEKEFALRGSNLFVARLAAGAAPAASATTATTVAFSAKTSESADPATGTSATGAVLSAESVPFRFITTEPGVLDNIMAREQRRADPQAGEIEVEVKAVGLNFMNVMSALGIYPGYPKGFACLGLEFAGVVARTGSGVTHVRAGDRVMGISPSSEAMGKFVICKGLYVANIPGEIDFTEAATIPVAFMTAYIAMVNFGRLQQGERVLIHSATGGVGMAAIQIAKHIGAEIFATAGTEAKRDLLRKMGVQHVMDSRSLDFAREIRAVTHGEGIDMVLNSLTGEAMQESIKLLRGFGRFCEIGKKDIFSNSRVGMEIFKESIQYAFFDLIRMSIERPAMIHACLGQVSELFGAGHYYPLPRTVFPAGDLVSGFHLMSKGQHTGKIVFDMTDPEIPVAPYPSLFTETGTYLVTGGMGGLGLHLVEWMCGQGARNIVLTGRSLPSPEARLRIDELNRSGNRIVIERGDVSEEPVVRQILEKIRREGPPLKGVFHAAGMLHDRSILRMERADFLQPLLPKIHGAWHLHTLTRADELHYFVLFSSAASLLGSIGQGNYVAANAFLDALAVERARTQQPVTCINWGPVAEAGLAAASELRGQRLEDEGIAGLSIHEYIELLELILRNQYSGVGAMHFDYNTWIEHNPSYTKDKLLDLFAKQQSKGLLTGNRPDNGFREAMLAAGSLADATQLLETQLQSILAGILKTAPSRIDIDMPITHLGVDSLMAIQLRNRLEKLLGLPLSVTVFWNYPKLRLLAAYLSGELGVTGHFEGIEKDRPPSPDAIVEKAVNEMTEEEVYAELDKELEDIV